MTARGGGILSARQPLALRGDRWGKPIVSLTGYNWDMSYAAWSARLRHGGDSAPGPAAALFKFMFRIPGLIFLPIGLVLVAIFAILGKFRRKEG